MFITWFGFAGCSHTAELTRGEPSNEEANVNYSVIYYIHADADYLFHDSEGRPFRANLHVLETALKVAEQAHAGEVFIFYQQPQRKTFGFFPRRSSRFYHYINGEQTTRVNYRHPGENDGLFEMENQLFNQYRIKKSGEFQQRYFLYFGHEIPEDEGGNYHRTLPQTKVNTETFARGLQNFLTADHISFDLILLSTCNNGTPVMAKHLMPFTDLLLASPQNLHLSHFDSESFAMLEHEGELSPRDVAIAIAEQTYRHLSENVQTTITLSLYDFEIAEAYVEELYSSVNASAELGNVSVFADNTDCSEGSFFNSEKFIGGVKTWYRPARFGKKTKTENYTGWGCRPGIKN